MKTNKKESEIMSDTLIIHPSKRFGIGKVKVDTSDIAKVSINLNFLEKAIHFFKEFRDIIGQNEGFVDLAISFKFPLMIGHYDEKNKEFTGAVVLRE